MAKYNDNLPWYDKFNNYFPADAYSIQQGKEKLQEFFVVIAGNTAEFFGSTKDINKAKESARDLRDKHGYADIKIKRITRIGSTSERG